MLSVTIWRNPCPEQCPSFIRLHVVTQSLSSLAKGKGERLHYAEDYARQWVKQEELEPDTLSNWVTPISSLIPKRIFKLSRSMSSKVTSILNDKGIVDNLTHLHNIYVVVPSDKASNNILFVCKTYYIDCLVNELALTITRAILHIHQHHFLKMRFFPIISP